MLAAADTVNVPGAAMFDEVTSSVVEAVAPGAMVSDVAAATALQPDGALPLTAKAPDAQLAPSLLVTDTDHVSFEPAAPVCVEGVSVTDGAARGHDTV